jgi:hypothetical protein
VGESKGW